MHIIGPACSVACVRAGLRVTMRCEQRAFCSAQLCVSGKPVCAMHATQEDASSEQ